MSESHLEFYRRWHRLSKPYIQWQLEQFTPYLGRKIADVGCGLGNFTESLLDHNLYLGIDLDAELLDELARNYGTHSNVKTMQADLTSASVPSRLRELGIDTILCVNVIEHIENDQLAVSHLVEALPSGGYLCLLVPALPFLYGSLDELDGHYRRYTKRTLQERLRSLPVDLIRCYYFNLLGVPGWFLKARILKESTHADSNYRVTNALIPILKPVERLLPPPLGMSVIGIFRKH
ncbi:MAG: class I SAM-dependent methyltransferase [Chthoniobacterales bacterium]